MAADTGTLTPDALIELPRPPNGKHYELSDGDLIVVGNAGALHELIKTTVFEILTEYRLRTRSGRAFAETQFALRSDCARIPDVAWVSEERLQQIPRSNQAIGIAPDVAIEIVSDSEQPKLNESFGTIWKPAWRYGRSFPRFTASQFGNEIRVADWLRTPSSPPNGFLTFVSSYPTCSGDSFVVAARRACPS
jgi:hypothetical protein